jgi:hypothetical protein
MSAQLGTKKFLDETQKGCGNGVRTRDRMVIERLLPLGYYFGFVVVRVSIPLYYVLGCSFGPVNMETGVEPATC